MTIITYDFFASAYVTRGSLFPVRTIAIYAVIFNFIVLVITRSIIRAARQFFLRLNFGLIRTVIVGNSDNTTQLLQGITPDSGFKVVGVVASDKYVPEEWRKRQYENLDTAFSRLRPHAIIHTGSKDIEAINKAATEHHALYYYSPPEESIIVQSGNVEFVAAVPIILVRATPLSGAA